MSYSLHSWQSRGVGEKEHPNLSSPYPTHPPTPSYFLPSSQISLHQLGQDGGSYPANSSRTPSQTASLAGYMMSYNDFPHGSHSNYRHTGQSIVNKSKWDIDDELHFLQRNYCNLLRNSHRMLTYT